MINRFKRKNQVNTNPLYYLGDTEKLNDFFFLNTNSAIKRKIWEQFNFSEMLMSEDQEWAKRVLLAGYKIIYDPDAVVYHSLNYNLNQVFKRYFDSGATLPYIFRDIRFNTPNFMFRGLRYEKSQLKYLLKNNYITKIPYSLLYASFKFLGYFLGTKYKYLPKWFIIYLSNNPNYWKKADDIILLKTSSIYLNDN